MKKHDDTLEATGYAMVLIDFETDSIICRIGDTIWRQHNVWSASKVILPPLQVKAI